LTLPLFYDGTHPREGVRHHPQSTRDRAGPHRM